MDSDFWMQKNPFGMAFSIDRLDILIMFNIK